MASSAEAVARHRAGLRDRGVVRVEMRVAESDVGLLRTVARALTDPDQAEKARFVLRRNFGPHPRGDLKALLVSGPSLDGLDLERAADAGREVDL